jgi:hypothetical protein
MRKETPPKRKPRPAHTLLKTSKNAQVELTEPELGVIKGESTDHKHKDELR